MTKITCSDNIEKKKSLKVIRKEKNLNREKIAKKLVELRGERTQEEMADMLGVGQSTYAMWESGKRMPSDEKKIKIAELHKMTVQEIFFAN